MSRFSHAHVTGPDWRSLCDSALAQLGETGSHGQLGFIYASHLVAPEADRILDYLRNHTGVEHWVGTVGLGICSTGREEYDEPSLALMVTDLQPDQFHLIPPFNTEATAFLDASKPWRDDHGAFFGVVHGDPANPALPQLIEALSGGMDNGYLVGGLTSSEGLSVQFADKAVAGGLSGVLLSGEVSVATGLSQGCSLIGNKHRITECQRNIIVSIDERPALEVLKEDIGEILARDLTRIGGYIFAALPIATSDTGDYLVRNLVGIDPNQGLVAIGDLVEEGMAIQFARRDPHTARDDLVRMLDELKGRLQGEPKGALYHSCLGRGRNLFGEDSAEMQLIREHLGDVPLVGFYANGEICHHRLYGYTGVLTIFT